jgi:hypothetical protein
MKTAQDIINDARFELATLIITLMRKLDAYLTTGDKSLMTGPEESVVIDSTDLYDTPIISVEVDNSYLGVEGTTRENKLIDYISTTDDCNFQVGVYSGVEEDDVRTMEIDADLLSTDELVAIAKCLEKTYEKA